MQEIRLRPPYSFELSTPFWRRSTGELTEQWGDGVYRRLVPAEAGLGLLALRPGGTLDAPLVRADVQPLDQGATGTLAADELAGLARRLLNDELDLAQATLALSGDPLLAPLLAAYRGLRPVRPPALWEALVWAICAQQITLVFALRLKERLVRRFGVTREVAGRPLSTFPTPAALAEADEQELLGFQFSRSKASFIVGLAQAIAGGALDPDAVERMPTSEALRYLVSFRGVGPWTAEYALLRGLGRPDAFPAGDAGVRAALVALGALPPRPSEQQLRAWAEPRQPWAGLAALYLWRWRSEQ
jgi:DNA-3-methyladenine glycosylase II